MHTVNGVPYILYFYTYTIHEIRPPLSKKYTSLRLLLAESPGYVLPDWTSAA